MVILFENYLFKYGKEGKIFGMRFVVENLGDVIIIVYGFGFFVGVCCVYSYNINIEWE